MTPVTRAQLEWDQKVGHEQAVANAARARSEVRSIRAANELVRQLLAWEDDGGPLRSETDFADGYDGADR